MELYHLIAIMVGLAAALGWIALRIVAMMRNGDPWLAVGSTIRIERSAPARPAPTRRRQRQWPRLPDLRGWLARRGRNTAEPAGSADEGVRRRSLDGLITADEASVRPRPAPPRPSPPPASDHGTADAEPKPVPVVPEPEEGATYAEIEAHLDRAFDLFDRGLIEADGYIRIVTALRDETVIRLARLREAGSRAGAGASARVEHELAAGLEAIDWCLAWARDSLASAAA